MKDMQISMGNIIINKTIENGREDVSIKIPLSNSFKSKVKKELKFVKNGFIKTSFGYLIHHGKYENENEIIDKCVELISNSNLNNNIEGIDFLSNYNPNKFYIVSYPIISHYNSLDNNTSEITASFKSASKRSNTFSTKGTYICIGKFILIFDSFKYIDNDTSIYREYVTNIQHNYPFIIRIMDVNIIKYSKEYYKLENLEYLPDFIYKDSSLYILKMYKDKPRWMNTCSKRLLKEDVLNKSEFNIVKEIIYLDKYI